MSAKFRGIFAGKASVVVTRSAKSVLPLFVLVGVLLNSDTFLSAQIPLLSGIQNARIEVQKQRADYPGPISYSPNDPETRSKLFRWQTGHAGLFYNCDGEECKRNSPFICWNTQHGADWRNGACEACRRDRADIKQRLIDGCCSQTQSNCKCNSCQNCQAATVVHDDSYEQEFKDVGELEFENDTIAPPVPQAPTDPHSTLPSVSINKIIRSWGDPQPKVGNLKTKMARARFPQKSIIARAPKITKDSESSTKSVLDSQPAPIQRTAILRRRNWTGKIATQDLVVRPTISLVETEESKEGNPSSYSSRRVRIADLDLPLIR